jgi:DNA repair protein SbcD/Mre11
MREESFMNKNPVHIAQMSDLHYSAGNLEEANRCFTASVSDAIAAGVDAAIITGDSTDHAIDAHSPAFYKLQRQIKRLADHCPVLMLQGTFSHEPVGFLRNLALIGAKHPVTVADKIGTFGLTENNFELVKPGKAYQAVVHAIPTLNKADIASLSANNVGAAAMEAGRIIAEVLASWAAVNIQLRNQGTPSMVISHGTVVNCLTEHGVPMAGQDHEFGVGALFAAQADVVALGHIHKHQSWKSMAHGFDQTIAYAGSIGRFHHGEEGDKFWLRWNLLAGQSSFNACVTPSRKTIDFSFSGVPDLDALRAAAASCEGAYVRVRYEVDEEHRAAVDRNAIKAILEGCAGIQIEGKTLVIERSRAAGISTETDVHQKLLKWGLATGTPTEALSERLTMLQNNTVEDIVGKVISFLPSTPVVLQNTPIAV